MRSNNYFGRRLTTSRPSERHDSTKEMRFSDNYSALLFLRNVQYGGGDISALRNILKAEQDGSVLHQIDDHGVLEKLSRMLCSGRIKLYEPSSTGTKLRESARSANDQKERSSGSGAVRSPDPKPRREPRPMPPPKQRPVPRPKPVPAINIKQQVAVLLAAATDGTPFCEQCEKARGEREVAQ